MKNFLIVISFGFSLTLYGAEEQCNTLKDCAKWAMDKTSAKYELGNLGKRSIKLNKDFLLSGGDPDFIFSFLLIQNDFYRVKRENGAYQIILARDLKNFQFPQIIESEIPATFDFYSVEFSFANKVIVKNAMQVFKKYISKEGRLLEVANASKIIVTESGIVLQSLRAMAKELNK